MQVSDTRCPACGYELRTAGLRDSCPHCGAIQLQHLDFHDNTEQAEWSPPPIPHNAAAKEAPKLVIVGLAMIAMAVVGLLTFVGAVALTSANSSRSSDPTFASTERPERDPSGRFKADFPGPTRTEDWDFQDHETPHTQVKATGTYTDVGGARYQITEVELPAESKNGRYFIDERRSQNDFIANRKANPVGSTDLFFDLGYWVELSDPFSLVEYEHKDGRHSLVVWVSGDGGFVYEVACIRFNIAERERAEEFVYSFKLRQGRFADMKLVRYTDQLDFLVREAPYDFWVGEDIEFGLEISGGLQPYLIEISGLPFGASVLPYASDTKGPRNKQDDRQRWTHVVTGTPSGEVGKYDWTIVIRSGAMRAEKAFSCTLNEAIAGYEPQWEFGGHSVLVVGRPSTVWIRLDYEGKGIKAILPIDRALAPTGTTFGYWENSLHCTGTPTKAGTTVLDIAAEYFFFNPNGGRGSKRKHVPVRMELKVVESGEVLKRFANGNTLFLLVNDDASYPKVWEGSVRPEIEGALKAMPATVAFNLATITRQGYQAVFETPATPTEEHRKAALLPINEAAFSFPSTRYLLTDRIESELPETVLDFSNVVLICPVAALWEHINKGLAAALLNRAKHWKPAKLTVVFAGPLGVNPLAPSDFLRLLEDEGIEVFFMP